MAPSACTSRRRLRSPTPEGGKHHDDRPEILGVQLEEVAAPIPVEHPVELRQHRRHQLLGRHREEDGVVPASARSAGAARRVRDVLQERQHLDRRDAEAQRARRRTPGRAPAASAVPPDGPDRGTRGRASRPPPRPADSRSSGNAGSACRAPPSAPAGHSPRAGGPGWPGAAARSTSGASADTIELAVVTRPHHRGDDAGELVRQATDHRARSSSPAAPGETRTWSRPRARCARRSRDSSRCRSAAPTEARRSDRRCRRAGRR